MRRVACWIMFYLLLANILISAFNLQPVKAEPRTWIVDDDGPADFRTIGAAVKAASDGDTIFVRKGTYYENVIVNKTLMLTGENQYLTIIDGNKIGWVVIIASNNTVFENFTVKNGGAMESGGGGVLVGGYQYKLNNCSIKKVQVTSNFFGIGLDSSSNVKLREVNLSNNYVNFGVVGEELSNFIHDIDSSNLIDNSPIYYLVNQKGLVINSNSYPNVGYLALVNCTQMTVENLTLNGNMQGLLLAYSSNCSIRYNYATNNGAGINLVSSTYNTIKENSVSNNGHGILLYGTLYRSSHNQIVGNIITNNYIGAVLWRADQNVFSKNYVVNNSYLCEEYCVSGGIYLWQSHHNNVYENDIINNSFGANLEDANNNCIYHNNFINNTFHTHIMGSAFGLTCTWDNGYPSGGNYWSNCTNVDLYSGPYQNETGSDGIGDTPYIINAENIDKYPLMAPYKALDVGVWNDVSYHVDIISNSSVTDIQFNPDIGPFLKFNVTGDDGTTGFCRVTIPKSLLWAEDGWVITVGENLITNYIKTEDENYTYLFFTYNHTTHIVIIQGTHVIPEFPLAVIPAILMVLIIFIAASVKKRKLPQNIFTNS